MQSFLIHNFRSVSVSASARFFISNLVAKNPCLKLGQKLCNLHGIVNVRSPFSFPQKVTRLDIRKQFFIAKISLQS